MLLDYRNDFDLTSTAGMAEFDDMITVDSAPPGGDYSPSNGESIPVILIPASGDPIHTRCTGISGMDLTMDYTASADIPGPVRVICAPDAQTMRTLQSIQSLAQSSPYNTSHTVVAGIFNDLVISGYSGTAHTVTLSDPIMTADFDDTALDLANRTTILLKCDSAVITFTFTPPSGYTFRWANGVPAPTTGKLRVLVDLITLGTDIYGQFTQFA